MDAGNFIKYNPITENDRQNEDEPDFDATAYANEATPGPTIPKIPAQDLHKLLQVILAPYKQVQDGEGIEWDLFYKNKVRKLLLVPFVLFVKGGGVEHDKHC